MRPLRDPVIRGLLLAAGSFWISSIAAGVGNPYFPLAVGNSWTYRCSIEGEYRLEKTLRIVGTGNEAAERAFIAELRVKGDARPLVQTLTVTPEGTVVSTYGTSGGEREPLITASPQVGDRIGAWIVGDHVTLDTPARKKMQAVRVETFAIDGGARPREEWRGRFYVRGIGPAGEADGLGGECVLARFNVR